MLFKLVRAGLWEQDITLQNDIQLDFEEIFMLAESQSVIGLVAAGLDHVTNIKLLRLLYSNLLGKQC